MRDMVLIINFDELNSRSVARKLRAERVYCKIVPATVTLEEVKAQEPLGLILTGASKGMNTLPGFDQQLLCLGVPILALGDAGAVLCSLLGGHPEDSFLERSAALVTYDEEHPLFFDVAEGERMMASVRPLTLCETLNPAAWVGDAVIGFVHKELPICGLQFQVEQNDPDGIQILANFALQVCGCTAWWDNEAFITRAVEEIQRVVGEGTALCALSGGVDSAVCALLGHKAIGARLKCIFVDTGLMRKDEGDILVPYYQNTLGLNITRVNAGDRFLRELAGVSDPKEKQQIIHRLLQDILDDEVKKTPDADVLLEGTNYTDTMHHNDVEIAPAALRLHSRQATIVTPVRELFKDEIRRVGETMGLPPEIYSRQPFPGSGLAIRILGEVTPDRLHILQEADAIFLDEIAQSGQGKRLWQYFAVLSDNPRNEFRGVVICLRAVHASEGTGAMAARLPYDLLERTVDRILKALPQVARVVYDLTPSGSYAGIEWQ